MVKNLPASAETGVQPLGWEDPLKEEMATHSSILLWEIPWTKESGRLQSLGSQKSWTQLRVNKWNGVGRKWRELRGRLRGTNFQLQNESGMKCRVGNIVNNT